MTHLRIELNNTPEIVSTSIVAKLYELASSGTLDNSSNLVGYLLTSATYNEYILALCGSLGGIFQDLYITANKYYILFADPEVLRVLLANGIGDGVGITLSDCENHDGLYSVSFSFFRNNTVITLFPEFRYFTNWKNKDDVAASSFSGCTNLANINIIGMTGIPSGFLTGCSLSQFDINQLANITYVGLFAFLGSGLSGELNLPSLTGWSTNCFFGTKITKVLSLGSVTSIDMYTFTNCNQLTNVTIPITVTSLENCVFLNCTALTTCTGFSNVTSIGNSCFDGCSSLASIDIDWTKVTSIRSSAFCGCANLFKNLTVTFPNVTLIDTNTFLGCGASGLIFPSITTLFLGAFRYSSSNLHYLEFGSNLTTIYSEPFWGSSALTTIVFRSTTVPTYTDEADRNFLYDMSNLTIYVPDASLNDYKTTGLWANMADHIKGISELPSTI